MKYRKLSHCLCAVLAGVTLACTVGINTGNAQIGIAGTNNLLLVDFDNSPSWTWGYGYDYSWGGTAPASGNWAYMPLYSEVTNVCYGFWFTNAPYQDLVNAGGQYGIGFGGPTFNTGWDPFSLSTNLEDYIFSFDARVEGLLPGQKTGNCEMQAQWQGPVNPDPNKSSDHNLFQLNFDVAVPTNWTHYSFLMSDASGTAGYSTLSNWQYCIWSIQINGLQWNVDMSRPDNQFGFDADNAVYIDNISLDMIVRTGAPPVALPTTPETALEWNFDDKPMWGRWGGDHWSANSYVPLYTYPIADTDMDGYGVGGSRGWWLKMDNSQLAPPNTPAWAGGQNGGNGPADMSKFKDGDLSHYVFECDARVEGLDPNTTATTVTCQLFLNGSPGARVDFNIPASSNWVHTVVDFKNANDWRAAAEKAAFPTNFNTFTGINLQWQINSAPDGNTWDYDTDNLLVVDNLKLTHLTVGLAPVQIFTATNHVIVTWAQPSTGSAILVSGDTLDRVTNVVAGASSPYVAPLTSAPKYFRTQWVPPPSQ